MHILIVSLLFLGMIYSGQSERIIVYEGINFTGEKEFVNIDQCTNLDQKLAGKVSSVETMQNCAVLYDDYFCHGFRIELTTFSEYNDNLEYWEFNDQARSVGPCTDTCSDIILNDNEAEGNVTIFSLPSFAGTYETLSISGCTLIPTQFIYQLSSVKFGAEKCIRLFHNVKCDPEEEGLATVDLHSAEQEHHLKLSRFSIARSARRCKYMCEEDVEVQPLPPQPPVDKLSKVSNQQLKDSIIVYDDINFEGNRHAVTLNGCVNLRYPWEGIAMSVKVNNICVTLYDRRDCSGEHLNITTSMANLPEINEELFFLRSLKACNAELDEIDSSTSTIISTWQESSTLPISTQSSLNIGASPGPEDSSPYSPGVIIIIVICPLVGVLFVVFAVTYYMQKCYPKKKMRKTIEKEYREFLYGLGLDLSDAFNDPENRGDYSAELLARNKPYNNEYEFPRSSITFEDGLPIGQGEFGVVYKGTVRIADDGIRVSHQQHLSEKNVSTTIEVAIKTVLPNSNIQYLRNLLKEAKVMQYVGKHENVVRLIGCCTENLRTKGEVLVLVEYCENGSMESFLQKNQDMFRNYVVNGRIDKVEALKMQHPTCRTKMNSLGFDILKLLQWCCEIAARNILLDRNFCSKISDFGLSKQLYCYTQYVKKQQEPLPWRWLALESLKCLEFSTSSDVWSYGVLCWEIFTLGEKPYAGVEWSPDFFKTLEDGLRLKRPKYAPRECYNIMFRCWDGNPMSRPTFAEIQEEFGEILENVKILLETPTQSLTPVILSSHNNLI